MASDAFGRSGQFVRQLIVLIWVVLMASPLAAVAAPYAAMVIDARTGEVLHSRNAGTQLHPASLTKMMTLYVVFEAVENGEISLDTMVTISGKAAAEPPSKIGFRKGQKVRLRYLIRAAAVKSANDAATALGEAISGSEAAFAARMNRTAKALGMTRTNFINMHGLTEAGHMSTARDMTTLGRHLFFDYPQYYNLFSRVTTNVNGTTVANTNRRFLEAYRGADGIKTGYTRAAGFNLVASAERGKERVITTVFGGQSTASRNAKVAELMDLGFSRAPTNVTTRPPQKPPYRGNGPVTNEPEINDPGGSGKTIRLVGAPTTSPRPKPRPAPDPVLTAQEVEEVDRAVDEILADVVRDRAQTPTDETPEETTLATTEEAPPAAAPDIVAEVAQEPVAPEVQPAAAVTDTAPVAAPIPPKRPAEMILTASTTPEPAPDAAPELVTRLSTSGGRHWGINVGLYGSRGEAERMLLRTALSELTTLGDALRKVSKSRQGYNANFVGMTKEGAELACRRLSARNGACTVIEAASG